MYKMEKEQTLAQKIDALVVGCALGMGCDEAELVRLAIEYAHAFRPPYALADVHLRSMETREERDAAMQMEAKVNKVITKTIQRERPMGAMSRVAMERFSMQPTPNLRTIMRPCKCTGPTQSPHCRLQPALCKTAVHTLSRTVPRTPNKASPKKSPKASSPKTRKSNGGKPKSKSCKRR